MRSMVRAGMCVARLMPAGALMLFARRRRAPANRV
jgi:hypothetical protein